MNSSTKVFLYHQRHRVILKDNSGTHFDRRWEKVYSKNLTAHRGTDNRILIEFVNQDQKPVDLTGMEFTVRLMTPETLLLEKEMLIVNAERGQGNLILTEQELDEIDTDLVGYSIERHGTYDEPVYVDDNAGGRGELRIINGIMPRFIASPSLDLLSNGVQDPEYTSIISTDDVNLHTFVFNNTDFTGTLIAQGATDVDDNWYDISSNSYILNNDLIVITVKGYHPYLRFRMFDVTNGQINSIIYR